MYTAYVIKERNTLQMRPLIYIFHIKLCYDNYLWLMQKKSIDWPDFCFLQYFKLLHNVYSSVFILL